MGNSNRFIVVVHDSNEGEAANYLRELIFERNLCGIDSVVDRMADDEIERPLAEDVLYIAGHERNPQLHDIAEQVKEYIGRFC